VILSLLILPQCKIASPWNGYFGSSSSVVSSGLQVSTAEVMMTPQHLALRITGFRKYGGESIVREPANSEIADFSKSGDEGAGEGMKSVG